MGRPITDELLYIDSRTTSMLFLLDSVQCTYYNWFLVIIELLVYLETLPKSTPLIPTIHIILYNNMPLNPHQEGWDQCNVHQSFPLCSTYYTLLGAYKYLKPHYIMYMYQISTWPIWQFSYKSTYADCTKESIHDVHVFT